MSRLNNRSHLDIDEMYRSISSVSIARIYAMRNTFAFTVAQFEYARAPSRSVAGQG